MDFIISLVNNPWFFIGVGIFIGSYILLLALVLAIWTARDIWRRSKNPLARIFTPLFIFIFGFLGFIPYLALRPRKTLAERAEEEREAAIVSSVAKQYACPSCRVIVERDFAFCPNCKNLFQPTCGECGAVIDPEWKRCAYCSTEVDKAVKAKKFRPAVLLDELDDLADVIEEDEQSERPRQSEKKSTDKSKN